ncbi:MAG: Hpt domain-containing protein, partial [Gammaproteobacteria bacterium]|nr:Hpt domain-containing protein [Gammaproteobacteria bacterium]
QLRAALQRGRQEAGRLVHSLKGVAGNLGAADVYRAAQLLETACREDQADLEGLTAQLLRELERVLQGLAGLEEQPAQPTRPLSLSPAELAGLMEQLRQHLAENDFRSRDLAEQLARALTTDSRADQARALQQAALDYDFERAAVLLVEISGPDQA